MDDPGPDPSSSDASFDGDQEEADLSGDPTPSSAEEFLGRVARGEDGSLEATEPPDLEGLGRAPPRFEIRRRLGAGGFGVVYEAFDRKRNAHVALKKSMRRDPEDLHRFKRELRALSDLDHPNLVRLYKLHGDDAAWFFTMELGG